MKLISKSSSGLDCIDVDDFLLSRLMGEVMEQLYCIQDEECVDTRRNITDEKKLIDRYVMQFSGVSKKMEVWASQRRMLLRKIEKAINDWHKIKLYTSKSKIVFSTIDIIGTTSSIILEQLQIGMASNIRYLGAAFGCLSFICSLFEISKTSFVMEDILKDLRNDSELLFETQKLLLKLCDFDKSIQNLFPHGIDIRVVKRIQQKGIMKRQGKKNDSQKLVDKLTTSDVASQVYLAILVTNVKADSSLKNDDEFLTKTKMFSKSSLAELWWNRVKYQGLLPSVQKSRSLSELNAMSRIESMPIRTFPLLSSPMWHLKGMPTAGSVVLNSLVVFDAYCELTQGSKTREADVLKDLKYLLETEYKNIEEAYQKLSPDSD
ncbi:uncharacterized protein TNCT_77721 [Trichonephila clavata]|uniref:Uncharacterized protein n=1 Tax=Trichonephila clavata TaxID=2740835 RepID=A0A8X6GNC9_TRICU|nr:uncharacterized protein TNCT_77721 [Trichonephila clavata]